jgi:hypothetical protein
MIETQEMLSQSAQLIAAQESEAASMNAARLAIWQAKYWYRCAVVPAPVNPPEWPAVRCSIPKKVVPFKQQKAR